MGGEHWTTEWVTASVWIVWGIIWIASIYNLWRTHVLLKDAEQSRKDAEDLLKDAEGILASIETGEGGGGNDEVR